MFIFRTLLVFLGLFGTVCANTFGDQEAFVSIKNISHTEIHPGETLTITIEKKNVDILSVWFEHLDHDPNRYSRIEFIHHRINVDLEEQEFIATWTVPNEILINPNKAERIKMKVTGVNSNPYNYESTFTEITILPLPEEERPGILDIILPEKNSFTEDVRRDQVIPISPLAIGNKDTGEWYTTKDGIEWNTHVDAFLGNKSKATHYKYAEPSDDLPNGGDIFHYKVDYGSYKVREHRVTFKALFRNKHYTKTFTFKTGVPAPREENKPSISKEVIKEEEVLFTDIDRNNLEGEAILYLADKDIINGYPDKTFKPNNEINRAELTKIVFLASNKLVDSEQEESIFNDVDNKQWYAKYISAASRKNIITGYPDGSFRPSQPINTAEFLAILTRSFGLKTTNEASTYNDVSPQDWFADYASIAQTMDLLPSRNKNNLLPAQNITRGEVAVALYKYFQRQEKLTSRP